MTTVEIRIPEQPECWQSCGICRTETLTVVERLVSAGQTVDLYQTVMIVEAYKTELEVVSPAAGRLDQWLADLDDEVSPGELIALLNID